MEKAHRCKSCMWCQAHPTQNKSICTNKASEHYGSLIDDDIAVDNKNDDCYAGKPLI